MESGGQRAIRSQSSGGRRLNVEGKAAGTRHKGQTSVRPGSRSRPWCCCWRWCACGRRIRYIGITWSSRHGDGAGVARLDARGDELWCADIGDDDDLCEAQALLRSKAFGKPNVGIGMAPCTEEQWHEGKPWCPEAHSDFMNAVVARNAAGNSY